MFSESHLSSISGTKMKKLLLAIFIILPLGGCTVHGNKSLTDENHQTVKVKIVKEKQPNKKFLLPLESATNDGQEMWNYSSMTGESQLSNYIPGLALLTNSSTAHIKSLDIWFKGDVVERYDFRQTASKTSRGLMD